MDYSKLTPADALAELEKMPHITVEIIPPSKNETRITYKVTVAADAFPHDNLDRGGLVFVEPNKPSEARSGAIKLWRSIATTLFREGADLSAYPQFAEEFEIKRRVKELG